MELICYILDFDIVELTYKITAVLKCHKIRYVCRFSHFTSALLEERNRHLKTKHFVCAECDYCARDYEGIMRHAATHSTKRQNSETAALQQTSEMADHHEANASHAKQNNNVIDFACNHCDYRVVQLECTPDIYLFN